MKEVVIVSVSKNTAEAFQEQLYRLLGGKVSIGHYFAEGHLPALIRADLVLCASQEAYLRVKPHLADPNAVLIARRSVNYHEVGKLFEIPPGTDVLLVNDMGSSACQTILHLQTLGIDHINYHPYTPAMQSYPHLPIAVTPGERELVPDCVTQIIDIKTRLIDISTLVELLLRLGLLELYADFLSADYVRDIIRLIRDGAQMIHAGNKVKLQLQTILNTVHDGIIATDETGRITVLNPIAEELLDMRAEEALGSAAGQLMNEKLLAVLGAGQRERETLIKVNQHHLLVNIAKLSPDAPRSGKVYTCKDVSEIRRMEETVRRRLIDEQKVARYDFSYVVGESLAIRSTLEIAEKMAHSGSTILIQGESGTGKEIIAQGIHNASLRRDGPFIAVNFAALTEGLLESELFGYIAGAFTGAGRNGAPGLFEEAHKGTIFLDEIGDAPLPFQVKLLRVLQEQQIRRVGSSHIIPVDVRVIVATNRDLKTLIANGLFRRDLYYRLNVLPIQVPPLRDRGGDILLLAHVFYRNAVRRKESPSSAVYFQWVAPYFLDYHWPGNVRELQNVVEYLVNVCPDAPPLPGVLPGELRDYAAAQPSGGDELCGKVYEEIAAANRRGCAIGRRSLADRLRVPENQIRGVLRRMAADGAVIAQKGRAGLRVNPDPLIRGRLPELGEIE